MNRRRFLGAALGAVASIPLLYGGSVRGPRKFKYDIRQGPALIPEHLKERMLVVIREAYIPFPAVDLSKSHSVYGPTTDIPVPATKNTTI